MVHDSRGADRHRSVRAALWPHFLGEGTTMRHFLGIGAITAVCLLLLAGCASRPRATVAGKTTDPVTVNDGSREVSVNCTEKDTVLKIGGSTITVKGSRGYSGIVESARGHVQVGDVVVFWDQKSLDVQGPKKFARIILDEDMNLMVDQDGGVYHSILKP